MVNSPEADSENLDFAAPHFIWYIRFTSFYLKNITPFKKCPEDPLRPFLAVGHSAPVKIRTFIPCTLVATKTITNMTTGMYFYSLIIDTKYIAVQYLIFIEA